MSSKIILPPGLAKAQTIDDYKPLDQKEVGYVAQPVMQALAQGCPPDAVTQIQFGVLCRLLVTIKTLGMAGAATEAERDALVKELDALKAAAPRPVLQWDFEKVAVEVNPLTIIGTGERPYADCPVCERVLDENGSCHFCADPTTDPSEIL